MGASKILNSSRDKRCQGCNRSTQRNVCNSLAVMARTMSMKVSTASRRSILRRSELTRLLPAPSVIISDVKTPHAHCQQSEFSLWSLPHRYPPPSSVSHNDLILCSHSNSVSKTNGLASDCMRGQWKLSMRLVRHWTLHAITLTLPGGVDKSAHPKVPMS